MANLYGQEIKYNNSSLLKSVKDVAQTAEETSASKPVVFATTTSSERLTLKYEVSSGDSRNMSLSTPKSDLSDDEIKSANATMIEKGDIFEDSLKNLVSATATITTKNKYDV